MSEQVVGKEYLLERLQGLQERENYLTEEAIINVAREMSLPVSHVYGVATFYSLYSTKPRGKFIVRVCDSAPCHIDGAKHVLDAIKQELGIDVNSMTADGLFSLELTSCLGVCGVSPAVMVNDEVYGNLTPKKVRELLASFKGREA